MYRATGVDPTKLTADLLVGEDHIDGLAGPVHPFADAGAGRPWRKNSASKRRWDPSDGEDKGVPARVAIGNIQSGTIAGD
jgi:hypothetical protein